MICSASLEFKYFLCLFQSYMLHYNINRTLSLTCFFSPAEGEYFRNPYIKERNDEQITKIFMRWYCGPGTGRGGVGWQYVGWQKQIVRHENALNFWKVEVPKMQKKFPQFKPQNSAQMIAAENKQFAEQKK